MFPINNPDSFTPGISGIGSENDSVIPLEVAVKSIVLGGDPKP